MMAEKGGQGAAEGALKAAEAQLLRRQEQLRFWEKNAARLRRRNLFTGLTIGAFVVGIFSYTVLSVKQERIMEELDDEARIQVFRGPRTGANS